jgi:hypothetical protein
LCARGRRSSGKIALNSPSIIPKTRRRPKNWLLCSRAANCRSILKIFMYRFDNGNILITNLSEEHDIASVNTFLTSSIHHPISSFKLEALTISQASRDSLFPALKSIRDKTWACFTLTNFILSPEQTKQLAKQSDPKKGKPGFVSLNGVDYKQH